VALKTPGRLSAQVGHGKCHATHSDVPFTPLIPVSYSSCKGLQEIRGVCPEVSGYTPVTSHVCRTYPVRPSLSVLRFGTRFPSAHRRPRRKLHLRPVWAHCASRRVPSVLLCPLPQAQPARQWTGEAPSPSPLTDSPNLTQPAWRASRARGDGAAVDVTWQPRDSGFMSQCVNRQEKPSWFR
jgi:hypothetical protein